MSAWTANGKYKMYTNELMSHISTYLNTILRNMWQINDDSGKFVRILFIYISFDRIYSIVDVYYMCVLLRWLLMKMNIHFCWYKNMWRVDTVHTDEANNEMYKIYYLLCTTVACAAQEAAYINKWAKIVSTLIHFHVTSSYINAFVFRAIGCQHNYD